jgi:saccharopine dehydrogenase (NAD+, L-glutamate forming)
MTDRPYDIALLGATGFTGRLAAKYLATSAPKEVRWVLAGRDEKKLEDIRRSLEGAACPPRAVVRADVGSPDTLTRLCRDVRVLMTTVGPYARYGMPVVEAAVANGCDYVDITGEPDFVAGSIERFHGKAQDAGLRIVHCCGFDSIPHDLGAQFTAELLPPDAPMSIDAYVRSRGTFSGGTWHSAIHAFAKGTRGASKLPRESSTRTAKGAPMRIHFVKELSSWAVPLPTIDPQIVLRSAAMCPEFGPALRYGHWARVQRFTTVAAGIAGIGALVLLAQAKPTRDFLLGRVSPGDGPSEERRKKSWFEVTFVGQGGGKKVVTAVSGGDPGYDETAKMISESALCLALDRQKLTGPTGVVTTAAAMGSVLRERLVKAGMRFHVKEAP